MESKGSGGTETRVEHWYSSLNDWVREEISEEQHDPKQKEGLDEGHQGYMALSNRKFIY